MTTSRPVVRGPVVDEQTRCIHWASERDVVAFAFACCEEFYPCHSCHEETADHPAVPRPASDWQRETVLCGVCGGRMSVHRYLDVEACPHCAAEFNPGCRLHHGLYFENARRHTLAPDPCAL